jgi:ankyrin repeat protein
MIKEHKLSVTAHDKFKASPLHFAIINKEFKNVEMLISYGADVDAQDKLG